MIRGFLAITIGLSITLFLATNLGLHLNKIVFFGIDILLTILLFYLSKGCHKGKLVVEFKKDKLELSSYFPLFKRKRKYDFYWDRLSDVSFSDAQYFRVFVAKGDKEKVTFAIDYGEEVDRFEQVLNDKLSKLSRKGIVEITRKPHWRSHLVSDMYLKKNILPVDSLLYKKVLLLNAFVYEWNEEVYLGGVPQEGVDIGLIAQEVEKLFPEMVIESEGGFKTVAYYKLIPLLIETVKDQNRTIDDLKKELLLYRSLVEEFGEIKDRVTKLESK